MGDVISKAVIHLDNQINNQINNQDNEIYNNVNYLETPLSEIVCIKTFDKLQKEYLYCYVCKLEKEIITECNNCNELHDSKEYYNYVMQNELQYPLPEKSNLVCHKCFYLHSDESKVSNMA